MSISWKVGHFIGKPKSSGWVFNKVKNSKSHPHENYRWRFISLEKIPAFQIYDIDAMQRAIKIYPTRQQRACNQYHHFIRLAFIFHRTDMATLIISFRASVGCYCWCSGCEWSFSVFSTPRCFKHYLGVVSGVIFNLFWRFFLNPNFEFILREYCCARFGEFYYRVVRLVRIIVLSYYRRVSKIVFSYKSEYRIYNPSFPKFLFGLFTNANHLYRLLSRFSWLSIVVF